MSEVTWELSSVNDKDNTEKLPYVKELVVDATASEGQKEFTRIYNEMRATLLKNNLMKKR